MTDVNISVTAGNSGDTWIGSEYLTNNFGIFDKIFLKGNLYKGLFRFDLSGLPAGATCTAATLKLYAIGAEGSNTYNLYKITDANGDWVEGTKNASTAGAGEPCWNYKKYNTDAWVGGAGMPTAGTDYVNTIIASVTASSAGAGSEIFLTFNAAGLAVLESWFGAATNNGFVLITSKSDTAYELASGEHATTGYRPVLSLSYELPSDELTAADFTLSPVTFDAPVLSCVSATADLTAKDFTLAPVTFDAPVLSTIIITPKERIYTVDAESREYVIPAESREFYIDPDMRGVKIDIDSATKYRNLISYQGLTGLDLTLARATFDAPSLMEQGVPFPDPLLAFAPFGIYDDGDGTFSISPSFDLQTHAGITVNKTYYVATTGSDSDTGLSADHAFSTLTKALTMPDYDRIYIAAGRYQRSSGSNYNPTRNCEIIGVGNVYLTMDANDLYGAFTLVDSHYELTTVWQYVVSVCDLSTTDSYGLSGLVYSKKASVAEVDATAGSWYYGGGKLYIHTFDGRAPDANVRYMYDGFVFDANASGKTIYMENLNIVSKSKFDNLNLYAKDCVFDGYYNTSKPNSIQVSGITGILQNCTIIRSGQDGIQGFGSRVIELDCTINNCGYPGGDNYANGSSYHGGYTIRINGDYGYTYGAPIADASQPGRSWILGAKAHDNLGTGTNLTASNIYADAAHDLHIYCDQCVSTNPKTYDYADSGLHKHNCTGEATDYGSPVTYDY